MLFTAWLNALRMREKTGTGLQVWLRSNFRLEVVFHDHAVIFISMVRTYTVTTLQLLNMNGCGAKY